jgi:hypothetical protein
MNETAKIKTANIHSDYSMGELGKKIVQPGINCV